MNHESSQKVEGPFYCDSGEDGPVVLDSITVDNAFNIIKVEPNPLGSFGRGWSGQ